MKGDDCIRVVYIFSQGAMLSIASSIDEMIVGAENAGGYWLESVPTSEV